MQPNCRQWLPSEEASVFINETNAGSDDNGMAFGLHDSDDEMPTSETNVQTCNAYAELHPLFSKLTDMLTRYKIISKVSEGLHDMIAEEMQHCQKAGAPRGNVVSFPAVDKRRKDKRKRPPTSPSNRK